MDRATFETFRTFVVPGTPSPYAVLSLLTPDEAELYADLAAQHLRLEQEHIHQSYVVQHLP